MGEVLSVAETGRAFHMRLRVGRALKGITGATADLWSDASTDCGVRLEEGKRYVVYTSVRDGRMSIDACGYGRELAPGEPDPQLPPVPGSIYGRVARYDIDRIRDVRAARAHPLGPDRAQSPGRQGHRDQRPVGPFQFANVPPGTYPVVVDAGQGLAPWMAEAVVLPDPEACADTRDRPPAVGAGVRPHGHRRRATRGAGSTCGCCPTDRPRSVLAQHVDLAGTTDGDGRFSFDGLGPDNYVIAVNPDAGDATGRQPYAPAFFGGADRATATRIPVADGAAIELERPFVLPAAAADPHVHGGRVVPGRLGAAGPDRTATTAAGAMFGEFAHGRGPRPYADAGA